MSHEGRDLPSPLWDPEVNRAVQDALPELAIALVAPLLGSEEFTEIAIGASLGGLVVWHSVQARESHSTGTSMLLLVIPALALVRLLDP